MFDRFDRQLCRAGHLARGGQIVDASLVPAPRPRNTQEEKDAIKAGKTATEIWPDQPAKAAQKDVAARWTVKVTKPKDQRAARCALQLAIPVFGSKSHLGLDRRFGFIRTVAVTDAARHEGTMLRPLVTPNNTASDVWADTADRSTANDAWLASKGRVSRIHRKNPKGRPMPKRTARANAKKSAIRAKVEHVFAHQKERMGLLVRTIGIQRAEAKIGLGTLADNRHRFLFHERGPAPG